MFGQKKFLNKNLKLFYIIYMKKIILFVFIILNFLLVNIFFKYNLSYKESAKIYDRNGVLLCDVRWDKWRNISYQNIKDAPIFLKTIILEREDKYFYNHFWVDFLAILRAFYENIKNWKIVQWASTIDQQVIKLNMQTYDDRTFFQKLKEMFLAINLNFHYSKDDIFLYYINNLPFWNGVIWFKSACNIYYNKSCEWLNKWQLIYLFTISKYWSFWNYSKQAYLFAKSIWLKDYTKEDFYNFYKSAWFYVEDNAPFFIEYYKSFLNKDKIYYETYFDYNIYSHIEKIFFNLKPYLNKVNVNDACVIVMDKNQNIISMNLLRKYGTNPYGYVNGCLMKQQIWSAMKPFLYIKAMEYLKYTENTILKDQKVSYILPNWWKYEPKNFDLIYHGDVSLKKALWSSLNIPAVETLEKIWLDTYKNFLIELWEVVWAEDKFYDDFNQYWLSIALWTKNISPLDFSKMWTIFLFDDITNLKQKQFLEKYWKYIKIVKKILSENENRLLSFSENNWINIEWTFAKTWTSRHFKDGWACWGYRTYIVCVWAWNYDAMYMKESWVNTAWIIWNSVINYFKESY